MTDGSYSRKRAADLSGVGWIIFCKRTGLQMTGTFWEKSPSASSFRADMLGLACLHLLARAVVEFFNLGQWAAVILCDNKKALELSLNHRRRIKPSAKCADIRRSFRATKQTFIGGLNMFTYTVTWTSTYLGTNSTLCGNLTAFAIHWQKRCSRMQSYLDTMTGLPNCYHARMSCW
jgi:hypothetical protein